MSTQIRAVVITVSDACASGHRADTSGQALIELVANPVQFDVSAPQSGPAPTFAEQTDEILLELGLDWDRIIELKTAGAVT